MSRVYDIDEGAQGRQRALVVRSACTYLFARLSSMSMTDTLDFHMGSTSSCASLPYEYRV